MDSVMYIGIAVIVVQLVVIIYLYMNKQVVEIPKPCPEQSSNAVTGTLGAQSMLELPAVNRQDCPALREVSTVSASQPGSGSNTTEQTQFDLRCFGPDNYINQFTVRAGDFIDGFNITCKNTSDQYFPWVGGSGGTQTILPSPQGFSKMAINSNEFIYGMQLYDQNGNSTPLQGKTSVNQSSIDCGDGLLVGIAGKQGTNKYGTYITQISKGFCTPKKPPQGL